MLHNLRNITETHLQHRIYQALATHPNLPEISEDLLRQSFQHAGLLNLQSYKYFGGVSEISTAYAEFGRGLCENWTDIRMCEGEDMDITKEQLMAISFMNSSLIVSNALMLDAHTWWMEQSDIHWDLGLHKLKRNPANASFWPALREAIVAQSRATPIPDLVILLAEHAFNKQFIYEVKEALREMGVLDPGSLLARSYDPVFIAARGAAEFAKRWQGSTWNFIEPIRCGRVGGTEKDYKGEL